MEAIMNNYEKPSWDYCPSWANYLTQNENGKWRFWQYDPYPSSEIQSWLGGGKNQEAYPIIKTWKKTKQKRPLVTRMEARAKIIEYKNELRNLQKIYKLDKDDKEWFE
jgi:hypothetical protein